MRNVWLTPAEVAEDLRISEGEVLRLLQAGAIPAAVVGDSYRVWASDLDAWLCRGGEAEHSGAQGRLAVWESLGEGGVATPAELAEATGLNESDIRAALTTLERVTGLCRWAVVYAALYADTAIARRVVVEIAPHLPSMPRGRVEYIERIPIERMSAWVKRGFPVCAPKAVLGELGPDRPSTEEGLSVKLGFPAADVRSVLEVMREETVSNYRSAGRARERVKCSGELLLPVDTWEQLGDGDHGPVTLVYATPGANGPQWYRREVSLDETPPAEAVG